MAYKYRLVIFDFDGTLADTFPWFADAINKVAEKYHFKKIQPCEHETIRGFDARGVLRYLGVPLWKMPMIANYMRTLMTHDIQKIALFRGIEGLLRRLSGMGLTLAVVSSNSYENIRHVLGAELAALITYYECGVSVFGKEAKLRKILKRAGVAPAEAIYIGDEIRDSEAARRVGLAFGGASWGYTTPESLRAHAPNDVFAGVDDIVTRLSPSTGTTA
jgi:phosphoglycolate phosphatase